MKKLENVTGGRIKMDSSNVIAVLELYRNIDSEIDLYKESMSNLQEGETKEYTKRIDELKRLKVEVTKEVARLEYIQKKIIFDFYINNLKWKQIARNQNYSIRQCQNIRDLAVKNLIVLFNNNDVIKETYTAVYGISKN